MKLSDFISQQAVKAGIDVASETNKVFFDAAGALTVEIPDDLAKGIDNKFITLEAAKNNHPDIKGYYQKQTLDTIDKTNTESLKELGVPQDVIDQILAEQSTFKRSPLAFKIIKDLEIKKAQASKPDQAAWQKQIDDLQAALRFEKDTTTRTIAEKAEFEKTMRKQYRLNSMFANSKTIYDNLDPEEKYSTLEVIINRQLQDHNAKLDLDDSGNLILRKKDGSNFFGENNQAVNPQQFIDGVLSRKKLIITTPAAGTQNGSANNNGSQSANNGSNNAPNTVNGNRNGNATVSPLFKEHTETALKDLKNSAQVM